MLVLLGLSSFQVGRFSNIFVLNVSSRLYLLSMQFSMLSFSVFPLVCPNILNLFTLIFRIYWLLSLSCATFLDLENSHIHKSRNSKEKKKEKKKKKPKHCRQRWGVIGEEKKTSTFGLGWRGLFKSPFSTFWLTS